MRPSASPSQTKTMSPHRSSILFCCSTAFLQSERLLLKNVIRLGTDSSHPSTTMAAPYFSASSLFLTFVCLSLALQTHRPPGVHINHQHTVSGEISPLKLGWIPPPNRLFGSAENTQKKVCFSVRVISGQTTAHKMKNTRTKDHSRLHASQWHTSLQQPRQKQTGKGNPGPTGMLLANKVRHTGH